MQKSIGASRNWKRLTPVADLRRRRADFRQPHLLPQTRQSKGFRSSRRRRRRRRRRHQHRHPRISEKSQKRFLCSILRHKARTPPYLQLALLILALLSGPRKRHRRRHHCHTRSRRHRHHPRRRHLRSKRMALSSSPFSSGKIWTMRCHDRPRWQTRPRTCNLPRHSMMARLRLRGSQPCSLRLPTGSAWPDVWRPS